MAGFFKMYRFWVKNGSVVSALVLATLTMTVFTFSRDRGPESTVRRFHVALAEGREAEAISQLIENEEDAQALRGFVRAALQRGAQVQLGRVTTSGRQSYVDVVYTVDGNRLVAAIRYAVRKPSLRWQIDARETNDLRRRMFEFH